MIKQYIFILLVLLGTLSCSEDEKTLVLESKPSSVSYNNYLASIEKGQTWTSGIPTVMTMGIISYAIADVFVDGLEAANDTLGFEMSTNGEVTLPMDHTLSFGRYVLTIAVSNEFGTLTANNAITMQVVDQLQPVIHVNTPTGTSEVVLWVDPTGKPVDQDGNELGAWLPDVTLSFTDMGIGEVLMTPSDDFRLLRESDLVEGGSEQVGLLELYGPYTPKDTIDLTFSASTSTASDTVLSVIIKKVNLPYDMQVHAMDLSNEPVGKRKGFDETEVEGMVTKLIYGAMQPGNGFWNVQADGNHPVADYKSTPILRWLPFTAQTGYDDATSKKSESIIVTNAPLNVANAQELRIAASVLANKGANMTTEQYRCDIKIVSEEAYQAMLAMTDQPAKKAEVATWKQLATTYNTQVTAGAPDATAYGYYEFSVAISKADLPASASGQVRVLFHMVNNQDGSVAGYVAAQKMNIEGTFLDSDE